MIGIYFLYFKLFYPCELIFTHVVLFSIKLYIQKLLESILTIEFLIIQLKDSICMLLKIFIFIFEARISANIQSQSCIMITLRYPSRTR